MTPLISIVVLCYNEAGNLGPLCNSIAESCSTVDYEVIIVDDGSTDGSSGELAHIATIDSKIRVLTLKRNFGQTAALAAGIDHAKGEVIVPLDADGQNDPADIPILVQKLMEGYDVVSGWRQNRQDALFTRRIPSIAANWIISFVTGVHIHDYGCSLKAYRRTTIADIQLYGEMHRFLPAWCAWQGGKVAELPVRHHPRTRGQSKYGLFRIFKVIIDLITLKFFSGYLSKPNHLFAGSGLVFFCLSLLSAGGAVFDKFGPDKFPTYRIPLLLLAVFFALVSIFLVLMGLMAELLVRLYFQIRNHKPYRLADE